MFWKSSKKKVKELSEKTEKSFAAVKNDMDAVSKWVKHLDSNDKQLFDLIFSLRQDLSTIQDDVAALREGLDLTQFEQKNKQAFKKLPVFEKQTADEDVQKVVQTAVQTDNIYSILKGFSGNERALIFTLLNSEMKLSYEDLALLLGKERSTIRGQVNAIKQKSSGLIQEMVEANGKKRVFVPEEIKSKLQKYAKSRTRKKEEEI